MKKIVTLLLAVVMIVSLCLATSAETYIGNGKCTAEIEIKKADPANVVKDGKIGVGEYEKVEVNKDDLAINFISADCYLTADAMADTLEYYFSWDEVHGLNFAVKYDAYPLAAAEKLGYDSAAIKDGFKTTIEQVVDGADGYPKDNICFNVGVNFGSGWNEEENKPLFYYAIGKKIDGSSYLTGHWNQLGPDGQYEAVGGKDFEFSYEGTTVTCEWSVPFAEFGYENIAGGSTIEFTVVACAGGAEVEDELEYDDSQFFACGNTWSVALGQCGFLVQVANDNQRAKAHILDEVIPGPVAPATSDDVTTNEPATSDNANTNEPATNKPATSDVPTQEPVTSIVTDIVTSYVTETDDNGAVMTDDNGDAVTNVVSDVVSSVVTQKPNNDSPVTGDPMIIAAVVAAISACGVVVAKKRK